MPAYYDQPAIFAQRIIEPVDRFAQLPFYLVKNEVAQFPIWNEFDQLYGKIDWQSNQGNTMKGVTPQRSPVGRSFFFPNNIAVVPNKDVYQVTESTETAQIYTHDYESFQFSFLPSFQAFWDTYIQFNNKDIVEKIACANNQFIETNMWFNASYVWLCGTGLISNCPTTMGNAAGNAANSKTAAWLLAAVNGTGGNTGVLTGLTLRNMYDAAIVLQNDLAAPSFAGVKNMPKDNEGVKGKYVYFMSSEAWMNLPYDSDVSLLKSINLDLLFNDFKGSLFGVATVKIKKYPVRFSNADILDITGATLWAAGTPIDPEIFDVADNKWKPNPYYTSLNSAPYEIAWILGDSYAKTIKVGPPPKEFANKDMSQAKFYSMRWNGEVRLTDQFLIFDANGNPSTNVYGKFLKFISETTHGYLVGERRYAFPMVLRRQRPALNP